MKAVSVIGLLCLALTSQAAQTIGVSVCNIGHAPENVIQSAQDEAAYVFRKVGVEIRWHDCSLGDLISNPYELAHYVVRIKERGLARSENNSARTALGLTYVDDARGGIFSDVYYRETVQYCAFHEIRDVGPIFGYVIAHELGHLLLGRPHTPVGLMRANWTKPDFDAMEQRRLRFDKSQAKAIRLKLSVRSGQVLASDRPNDGGDLPKAPVSSIRSFTGDAKPWRTFLPVQ
jgi:hypothetical protein